MRAFAPFQGLFTRLTIWALAALLVAGCTSVQGVGEFALYQTAFDKTYAASTAILDQLAVQERKLFLRRRAIRTEADAIEFDPALAAYYTDAVDPPGTAAFRRALDTAKTFNDLLYGLASGQTAASLAAKLAELQTNATKAAADAAGVAGLPAAQLGQLTTLATSLNVAFTRLSPFAETAFTYRTREAFRTYLIAKAPIVREILLSLKDGTRVIFPVLTADTLRRARTDPTSGALTAAEITKIEGYRKLLADWTILLDATVRAFDAATAAATASPTLTDRVIGLNTIAVELETASQSARKHLAELGAQ